MNLKKGVLQIFIANAINLVISLFTGFVLPKLLSIETYSNIKLFQLYITYIGILHFGFSDGMYLCHGGKTIQEVNKKEIIEELKTFKIFQFIITIIAIIISIYLKNEMLLFCSLVILPINVGNYFRSLYQSIGEFKRYSKFTNVNTFLIFFINILLLLLIKTDNYHIYIIAYIIAYIVYWIILEIENKKLFKSYKAKPQKKYLVRNIKSGFFLMTGNFCNVIFTSIDRIFVQNLFGMIKFAFYSFSVSIQNLMSVFITPISTVMYNYLCKNTEKQQVINIKRIIMIFATIIIIAIFPAKFIIDCWLTKYSESVSVLFLLFSSEYISIIIRCIHINLYKAEKKQNRYFIIMIIIVLVSIILNFILYNIYKSMEMIALATLLTNIIWFIIGEIDFKKYKLKISEYIYMFSILIVYLITAKIDNSIMGCGIYIIISCVLIFIFMKETMFYCINESKKYLNNIILRIRKKEN